MQTAKLILAVAGLCLATSAAAQEIKPGLWEIKHDMQIPGQPDMGQQMAQMQEMLKNLPPEQRKMLEQQAGVAFGNNGALRICITPEDAKAGAIREGHSEGDCTYTRVKRTGNSWQAQMTCKQPPSQGDFKVTLHSPTHYSGTGTLTSKEHGRMTMKTEAHRVGNDCGTLGSMRQPGKHQPPAAR